MDELSRDEIQELAEALQRLRDELREMLASSREGSRPVDLDEPIGRLSRMDAMQQQQMVVANRAAHERRLQAVLHALRAVDSGTYGACRRCEEPIGVVRLRARPEAPFCLDCQEELDASR